MVTTETEKPRVAIQLRQANQVLAYRVREHNKKKRHPRNKSYERNTKRIKNKRIPRWGRVQVTQQAERTRTKKYVLAESSRRLLHRRRDTKKINISGCRKNVRKEEKNEKRKVGSKAKKQARKSYSRRLHSNKSSRLCYKAETGTLPHHLPSSCCFRRQRYQVSLLPLSSPPSREQINENETKLPGLGDCSN